MEFVVQQLSIQDTSEYLEFLTAQSPWSMSLLYDLGHGITPDKKNGIYADWFGAFDGSGELVGVTAQGGNGNVQVCSPERGALPLLVKEWAALRQQEIRPVKYFLGPTEQVECFCAVAGLGAEAFVGNGGKFDFFTLDLDKMVKPSVLLQPGIVVDRARRKDITTISLYRQDYHVEEDGAQKNAATFRDAKEEMTRRIADPKNRDIFALYRNGHCYAFGGGDVFTLKPKGGEIWAKVGPVFVPKPERQKGYAQGLTAGMLTHLHEEKGVTEAALFANNPIAKRAYEKLNFDVFPERWSFNYLQTPMYAQAAL